MSHLTRRAWHCLQATLALGTGFAEVPPALESVAILSFGIKVGEAPQTEETAFGSRPKLYQPYLPRHATAVRGPPFG